MYVFDHCAHDFLVRLSAVLPQMGSASILVRIFLLRRQPPTWTEELFEDILKLLDAQDILDVTRAVSKQHEALSLSRRIRLLTSSLKVVLSHWFQPEGLSVVILYVRW